MPVPPRALYDWHARPGAFERLMPPWQRLDIVSREGGIADGDRLVFALRAGPTRVTWEALHSAHIAGEQFVDEMVRGPMARWRHTHRFLPAESSSSSVLEDVVEFAPPLGIAGRAGGGLIRRQLERLFAFRHSRVRADLERWGDRRACQVVVSGSSGVVGSALCPVLTTGGCEVRRLVRRKPGAGEIFWQPGSGPRGGQIDQHGFEGADAVIHLAGENIAKGRWNAAKRERILVSRVESTRLLSHTLANLSKRPRVLIVASGTALYGDRGDETLTEDAGVGSGFLAEVVRDWEAAAEPARQAGIRVVHLRIGMGLSCRGGLLAAARGPASLGLACVPGNGRQWWSWISMDDVVSVILHVMEHEELVGGVNVVSPEAVLASEFVSALAGALDRGVFARLPAWVLRAALGEKAEVLLSSARVVPERLRATGAAFRYPTLDHALRWELGIVNPVDAGISFEWA